MARDISEQNLNIEFVKEVEKYQELYNFELPQYTRKDLSADAWNNVGRAMNMTPSACRERWRNLRAVFMRNLRSAPRGSTGKKKPYYLAEAMQFVVPFLRPIIAKDKQKQLDLEESKKPVQVQVEHIKEEVEDEEFVDSCDSDQEMEIILTRKRLTQDDLPYQNMKIAKVAQPSPASSIPLDSDHVKSFLNSLQPELSEMNSVQFKNFKRRVLLLIDDIMSEIPATAGEPGLPV